MNEQEFHVQNLLMLQNLVFSLLSLQMKSSSQQVEVVDALQDENQMGRDRVSKLHNLFIFTSPAPISLTVCLPWQWLFLDQLCIALASAPSLQSAHSGCIPACCQPTGLYQWQRESERETVGNIAEDTEHPGRKSFQVSMRKAFDRS